MNALLKPIITDVERARRKSSIDYARGSVRYEGIHLTPEIEAINTRYIDGYLTHDEYSMQVRQSILGG